MMKIKYGWLAAALALAVPARSAELLVLSPQNWKDAALHGKEADGIYGDLVLRNDRIAAVIANPVPGRNANMTVRNVGGAIIDLTHRNHQNDQLSAFYPGAQQRAWKLETVTEKETLPASGDDSVSIRLVSEPKEGEPDLELIYTLQDGWDYVLVETRFRNSGEKPVGVELVDAVRADHSFQKVPDGQTELFWVHDNWFNQAYAVVPDAHEIQTHSDARNSTLRYLSDGKTRITLDPHQSHTLIRRVTPGANLIDVKGTASRIRGNHPRRVTLSVRDTAGKPVADAEVTLKTDDKEYGSGRTHRNGKLALTLPNGVVEATITALGRGSKTITIPATKPESLSVELSEAGAVAAEINDKDGGAIPCKVQFLAKEGTEKPDLGPDSGEHGVRDVYYSHNGRFRQVLPPGKYDVIISHGPEFDAVFTEIEIKRGKETPLKANIIRSVQTPGWVSSDFHSHSSPSGDNTSSQFGRVLNLLCEHIEFAPCTEHNRISSYIPHLRKMDVEPLMATCSGMELTGTPLPLNHQNAFPLKMTPHIQDNGAPEPDESPEVQIERLALWDDNSEKLVQVNHPDIGWMFYDRDGDGQQDKGYPGMARHMDVIEVHPPYTVLNPPVTEKAGKIHNNTIGNWLQLLNQGYRIPGVVNTDAHYNYHGSGFLRNYLKSPTDDPAKVDTMDMVHAAEGGHLIMTNGPYLEVSLKSSQSEREAIAGDDLAAPDGKADLKVRVQCPNWFDVDRVQVLLNGQAVESLNFTREANADLFSDGSVKFDRTIPLELDGDTHVIVVAIGENQKLGPVMGPSHKDDVPAAVSNPIFVDVNRNGFQPNGDTLGSELPRKRGRDAEK